MTFKMNFYFQLGNELKAEFKALYHDIHSKLPIKMEENRKCKETYIKFGDIRKGMNI